ncbi:MAG: HAD-IC family P-type ATPase [Epsilonproteobacteria bacterium]|nr:HAD-IC family P-type ATPase [Campylobacterota bacterium]
MKGKKKMNWYQQNIDDIFSQLSSTKKGLSHEQAAKVRAQVGPNQLPTGKKVTVLHIFISQFLSPLIYILLIAAGISAAIGQLTDAMFIIIILLINAIVGSFQEWRADKAAQMLQKIVPLKSRTLRSGQEHLLDAHELVPGDIVILESGSKIPADMRLFWVDNVTVDESLLTGESTAVAKHINVIEKECTMADRLNMAYAGTTVTYGQGKGIVVCTGMHTQIGAIAQSVLASKETKTPLLMRFEHMSARIGYLISAACILVAAVALVRAMPYHEAFMLCIGLMVSAVPEGLPIAVTIALARGTQLMAARKVIVRKLSAVEGLGSCNCIATDKTGTLTVNQQTIEKVLLPDGSSHLFAQRKGLSGEVEERVKDIIKVGVLSGSTYHSMDNGKPVLHGDEVDMAFYSFLEQFGINGKAHMQENNIEHKIPFDSAYSFSAALYGKDEQQMVAIKGAAETIIPLCSTMRFDGKGQQPIDQTFAQAQAQSLYEQAYRVIAVAHGTCKRNLQNISPDTIAQETIQFSLLGFIGMIDPLRTEAADAVKLAQQAGVHVIMITGDHPLTAFTIASRVGIAKYNDQVMTGTEFERLRENNGNKDIDTLKDITVFARVTPLQKLQIIKFRKRLGDLVAVTGDGVNDAPALREAHIGVAMGSGTDIAKETSSIIITDDNFKSIIAGIEEGRTVYANLRKMVYLLISTGMAEVLLIVYALLFNTPMPLKALQFLWLNLVTNGIQDIALAFERENNILHEQEFTKNKEFFNRLMLSEVFVSGFFMSMLMFTFWLGLLATGCNELTARNLLFLLFVLMQNFHVLNCRSEHKSLFSIPPLSNKILIGCVISATSIHVLAMHTPVLQPILSIQPASLNDFLMLVPAAASVLVVMEIFKLAIRKRWMRH